MLQVFHAGGAQPNQLSKVPNNPVCARRHPVVKGAHRAAGGVQVRAVGHPAHAEPAQLGTIDKLLCELGTHGLAILEGKISSVEDLAKANEEATYCWVQSCGHASRNNS